MTHSFWLSGLAIFALLFLSAGLSLSETAVTGVSAGRMTHLRQSGNRSAARVLALIERRTDVIPALLIGNNLTNIFASALMTGFMVTLSGDVGVVYATLIMTTLIVLFGEIMPKGYALSDPDKAALRFWPLIAVVTRIFYPVAFVADRFSRFLVRAFGFSASGVGLVSGLEELRGTVTMLRRTGFVMKDAHDMLGGLLNLDEMEVSDVMVHRTKLFSVNVDAPASEILAEILASPFTRVPVWSGRPENIVGLIHGKDLLREMVKLGGDPKTLDIRSIVSEPWFVPSTTKVPKQLRAFRRRQAHFCFVVDEYGEFMGIVTLEDVLEEIVGDISDEHDESTLAVRFDGEGAAHVDGQMPIRDLNRYMDWNISDDEATTLAGFLIHRARCIPSVGQAFTFDGYRIEVTDKTRHKITALKIRRSEGGRSGNPQGNKS